jgi:acyl-CoA thioester hydrolase
MAGSKVIKVLRNRSSIQIRFSEVDSLGIVWHGNYVSYLEDGREAFGREFGLGYYDVSEQGFLIPIVKLDMDFKLQVKYGEEIIIETTFVNNEAAKIMLAYTIYRSSDDAIVLTANSMQVFINEKGMLELINPDFFLSWKKRMGISG